MAKQDNKNKFNKVLASVAVPAMVVSSIAPVLPAVAHAEEAQETPTVDPIETPETPDNGSEVTETPTDGEVTETPQEEEVVETPQEEVKPQEEVIPPTIQALSAATPAEQFTYTATDTGVTITKYNGTDENVIIPDEIEGKPVISVGFSTFANNKTVKHITLGANVTDVKGRAFNNATSLESVTFNEGLKTIGDYVFTGTMLTDIVLPSSIQYLSDNVFNGIPSTINIDLSNTAMTAIPASAFGNTTLGDLKLPPNLKEIRKSAFYGSKGLKDFTIPDSVTIIGDSIFGYSEIENVTIGSGVTKFTGNMFKETKNLKTVNFGSNITSIDAGAFEGSSITSVDFSSITNIGIGAFKNSKITSVVLTNPNITLGTGAFEGVKLTTVELPEGLTTIANSLFKNAVLPEIKIPSTVTTIGMSAYADVTFSSGLPQETLDLPKVITSLDLQSFKGVRIKNVFVPKTVTYYREPFANATITKLEYEEGIQTITGDSDIIVDTLIIPSNTKGVAGFLRGQIDELILGENIEYLGNLMAGDTSTIGFYLAKIGSMEIPASTGNVGRFSNTEIANLKINYSGKTVFTEFLRSAKVGILEYGEGTQTAPKLGAAIPVDKVVLPNSLTALAPLAFSNMVIGEIMLPNSVKAISSSAFSSSTLTKFTLGSEVKEIGNNAFYNAKLGVGYTDLDLSEVETIGDSAFQGSTLSGVKFGKVLTIGNSAFRNTAMQGNTIILPESLNSVGEYAFHSTTNKIMKLIILNKYLNFVGTNIATNFVNLSPSGNVYGYVGSTTETAFIGKGFKPLSEDMKVPTISSSLISGTTYMGSVTPTFDVKNAESVTYTLNGQPYDGVSKITNTGTNTLVVKAVNGIFEETKTYTFSIKTNNPPAVVKQIENQTVVKDDILKINLNEYFSDADGDKLTFTATTSDDVASRAWVTADGELKFTSAYKDKYTVKVKASDGFGESEEVSFVVDVTAGDVTPPVDPKPPVVEDNGQVGVGDLEKSFSEVINVSMIGLNKDKVINLSGLIDILNLENPTVTLSNTNSDVVSYDFDTESKAIKLTNLKEGFSNIQVVAQSGKSKVVILLMVDSYDSANWGLNYIGNGQIYAGLEAYVVPVEEVFQGVDLKNGDTFVVTVNKVQPKAEPVALNGGTQNSLRFASRNFVPTFALMASLAPETTSSTQTTSVQIPEGVDNLELFNGDGLSIKLVNGRLVVEGAEQSKYDISVTHKKADGTEGTNVKFALDVLTKDSSGGGTNPTDPTDPTNPTDPGNGGTDPGDGGNNGGTDPTDPTNPTDPTDPGNGGNNGGSEGGNTGGGNTGGGNTGGGNTGGGNTGGGNTGGDGGSNGGSNGGNNGGSTGGNNGGSNGGNGSDNSSGGSTGGNTGGNGSDGGSTGGNNNGENNNGGSTGGNNGGSETGKDLEEIIKDIEVEIDEKENGDLVIDINDDKNVIADNEGTITLTDDGYKITIGDKDYDFKFENGKYDFSNKRVIHNTEGKKSTAMHFVDGKSLVITTTHLDNLLITSREAIPFKDVKETPGFNIKDIEDLYNNIITTGTTATTYSPNASITRTQFAVMIARALEAELGKSHTKYTLSDIKGTWYADEVQYLVDLGIITGFTDGTFGGDKLLSRQQASAMVARMLEVMGMDTNPTEKVNFKDEGRISGYAKDAVHYLAQMDILVNGSEVNFNPHDNLTRNQMAKVLMRALRLTDFY